MTGLQRALLVVGLAALVAIIALALRHRPITRSRTVAVTGLIPGVYLLTSGGCAPCEQARATLRQRSIEFVELTWQADPEVFERLGIDAVPSVVLADSSGAGLWWRGGVPRRIAFPGPRGEIPRTPPSAG